MWERESILRAILRNIEPSPEQKSAASSSHNHLRALLDTGQFGNRIVDSYLSGSYARDTAISPIDDVDVVIVIDPEGWSSGFWTNDPDPDVILQSFAAAVRRRYPQSSVYVQRRSVRLRLNHLNIDVVPAIEVSGTQHRIRIPDSDSGEWISSAPKIHTELATQINQQQGGRFKPLVKLLKCWNSQLPDTACLKSFAIETIAATLFRNVDLPTLDEGLRRFFDFMANQRSEAALYRWPDNYGIQMNWWAHEAPDLAGTGSNLLARVDSTRSTKFLESAVRSRDALISAEKARTAESSLQQIRTALRIA